MKKHTYILCMAVIILTNLLMIGCINQGEEITSNFVVILIALFLFPGFLWAAEYQKTSFIRLESLGLFVLAGISLLRLLNRITSLPWIINGAAIFVAVLVGTLSLVIAIQRFRNK